MSKKNFKKPTEAKDLAEKKETVPSASKKEEIETSAKSYWEKKYEKPKADLLFSKQHYMIIGGGIALLFIGFFLMTGGNMADENTWDPKTIYSFTRITLAPIFVLLGLGVVGYALFFNTAEDKAELKKEAESSATEQE